MSDRYDPEEAMRNTEALRGGGPGMDVPAGGTPNGTKRTGAHSDPFPRKNAPALACALDELGMDYRYNIRSRTAEWRCNMPDATWEAGNDRTVADLRERIAAGWWVQTERGPRPLHFGRERWDDCLAALLVNREVDPFMVWLDGLPDWDEVSRVGALLVDMFGAGDDPLSRWAGVYLFLGTVQRTMEPGCKLDEIPVLIGGQGIGKSAVLRAALPPDMPALFSDGLRWDARAGDQVDVVLGRAVVEISEMAGRGRAEIEHMKAFVTRQDDGNIRRPYARHTEPALRRFVMVGTTNNESDLPNDPSGNRRFVPVPLAHGTNVEAFMSENRAQLWAEALHLYRAGERASLPRELMPLQAERAEQHRDRDDIVEDAVDALPNTELTMAQVREKLSLPGFGKEVHDRRIAAAMRNAGWTQRRATRAGSKVRVWKPPLG